MILFPPCKINLGLHILRKRPDGYHDLDTLMYQLPLTDLLEIVPSDRFGFSSSGLAIPGEEERNLCILAFRLMQDRYDVPDVRMHLHKIVPMGGGMGGGSADGAYVLLGLNALFALQLPKEELQRLAAELGSDCPLFIDPRPQIAQGRGEILAPSEIDLSGWHIRLVYPGIHVSTKEAFSKVTANGHRTPVAGIVARPVEDWKDSLANDFEASVFQYHPSLKEIKEQLYADGAVYASMTGSGSTMFGLYRPWSKVGDNKLMGLETKVMTLL